MGRFDKALVAWVALALALMLPAAQWQRLGPAEGVEAGRAVASQPLPHHGEEEHPSSPCEEPCSQSFELFEDDAVIHDEYAFVLAGLKLEITSVSQLEPDPLHARQLERPPLRTA